MNFKSPFLIASLLVGLSSFCFGLFVLMKAPKKRLNQLWFIFSISVVVWGFGGIWGAAEHNPHAALLKWQTISAAGITWISVLYFHFICHFLEIHRPRMLFLSYFIGAIFACLSFTPWIFSEVRYLWNEIHWPVAGPLHPLFFLWWTTLIFYSHWELWLHYKRSIGIRKSQIKLLFLASAIGYFCGALEYLPDYRIDLYPWANFGVAFYPYLMMYAILQYRLFDISFVIRRSIFYFVVVALLLAGYSGSVYTAQQLFRMNLLQHHVLALALTAATTFGLGLLVFLADPRRQLNRVFGLYSLAISWWALFEIFVASASNDLIAKLAAYPEWIGVILIAPTFLHTVLRLTDDKERWSRLVLLVAYVASLFFIFIHLLFDGIVVVKESSGYPNFFSTVTPIGMGVLISFFVLVNVGLWKLAVAYRHASGQKRLQLKFLFWGSVVGYVGGSADWALVLERFIPVLNPFGIYTVPLYSFATTYAVLQHRLFDVNLVARKSLVYSLLVTVLTVGYFGLAYGVERLFQMSIGYSSPWMSLAAFALMALAFQPLKIGIQRLVDWLLFRAPHEELVKRMERLEQEALQTEKLKAVATLAAGLCHELRNPLQSIRTFAEYLPERYDDPEFRQKCCETMKTEVVRVNDLLKQLMDFAKPKPPAFKTLEPHEILNSTLEILSSEFVKRDVALEKDCQANGTKIQADPNQLRQVIMNLTLNALEAIGQRGTVKVATRQENGWFVLEMADTGPGIDPKILPKLFEPFTTSKVNGTGLGLSIVHSIIKEHRGKISVQSQRGQGATFTVKLPT